MPPTRPLLSALWSLLPLTAALAAPPALAEAGWGDLNRAVIDGHIVPRYRLLEQSARTLEHRLARLCEAPTETALAQSRAGFRAALDAWSGISHIRFGPVETDRRWFRFQLWPDKRGTGQRQVRQLLVAADSARLAPDAFASESVAVQGLTALEHLLFPESEVGVADFAAAGVPSFRCRFAQAIGANLSAMAAATLADWTLGERPYRSVLLDPAPAPQAGAGGRAQAASQAATQAAPQPGLGDARAVSAELLKTLSTGAQVIHQQRLLEPLGGSGEQANPRKAESWRSRRSLANVCTALRALGHLYETGFATILRESGDSAQTERGLALTFAAAIDTCLSLPEDALDGPAGPRAPGDGPGEIGDEVAGEAPGKGVAGPATGASAQSPEPGSGPSPATGSESPAPGPAAESAEPPPWAAGAEEPEPAQAESARQREALGQLLDLAGALQSRTGRRLAEELDLMLGFNSLDGD
jgi:predicted lipoprotein